MVEFLLWDPYFFGYDSKLLGLGIDGQVMSFQDMCQLAGATAASAGATVAYARATVGIFG